MIKKTNYAKRVVMVLTFLFLFALYSFISYRGEYLQVLEIGENYTSIFYTNLRYKYTVNMVIFLIAFLSIYITTKIIKRGLKHFFLEEGTEIPKLPNKSISLIGAILISIFTTDLVTSKLMLAMSSTMFGILDPIFNMDIGYYIFQKPFIELVLIYCMVFIIGLVIYTVIYYIVVFNKYFEGINRETLKKNLFIKQIIAGVFFVSVIASILTYINSQNILFKSFLTLTDEMKTELTGAGVTDITIASWGYRILAIIIVIAIFMAMRSFKKSNTKKVVFWIGIIPSYYILMFVVMFSFQTIFVNSNKLDNEKKYIAYNIENTRKAYNVDIQEEQIDYTGTITEEDIKKNDKIVSNVPMISEDVVLKTLKEYQSSSGIYTYRAAKIQKYQINNNDYLMYVSPREILSNGDRISDNKLYKYTHGYGTIITSAVDSNDAGGIKYMQNDIENTEKIINVSNPRIYFGLETNEVVITNVDGVKEFDYSIGVNANTEFVYDGEAGISLGFFDRFIIGMNKQNLNVSFSGNLKKESKILINRNIIERVKKLMPYFTYDEEPYLVIRDDGTLVWVIDAYTTSNSYPYAQYSTIEKNGLKTKINYIRNSVKVIVDAYNGTATFYITDRTDPIAMAYRKIYPSLFVDIENNLPEDIAKYMTYPKYLYDIQSTVLAQYHNIETEVLYRNDDVWEVAKSTNQKTTTLKGVTMQPYYAMVKKGENNELGLIVPYTPIRKTKFNIIFSWNIREWKSIEIIPICTRK